MTAHPMSVPVLILHAVIERCKLYVIACFQPLEVRTNLIRLKLLRWLLVP